MREGGREGEGRGGRGGREGGGREGEEGGRERREGGRGGREGGREGRCERGREVKTYTSVHQTINIPSDYTKWAWHFT